MDDATKRVIKGVRSHLEAALCQALPSDDQIIIGHMRKAVELLGAIDNHVYSAPSSVCVPALVPETCKLCGRPGTHPVHRFAQRRV